MGPLLNAQWEPRTLVHVNFPPVPAAEVKGITDGTAAVDTPAGTLSGHVNAAIGDKARVNLVVPAEAIEVHAAGEGVLAGAKNRIDARIERSEVVGHIAHLTARLQDGGAVSLEAHVDKSRPGAFPAVTPVLLSWNPAEATVIPAH